MKLRFKGKPLGEQTDPPMVRKLIAACQLMPDGELLDSQELSARLQSTAPTIRQYSTYASVTPFRAKHHGRNYWGNAKTITALRKL